MAAFSSCRSSRLSSGEVDVAGSSTEGTSGEVDVAGSSRGGSSGEVDVAGSSRGGSSRGAMVPALTKLMRWSRSLVAEVQSLWCLVLLSSSRSEKVGRGALPGGDQVV